MKKTLFIGIAALAVGLGLVLPTSAFAKSIAMEHDGNAGCDSPSDMGLQTVGSGVTETFDVYFYDLPLQVYSANCTFCIQDASNVDLNSVSYTTNIGSPWTITPISQVNVNTDVDPAIVAAYPNLACWLVQGTDFTFTAPWAGGKHGTFEFTTTDETCIGFVFDGDPLHSGVFYTDFNTAGYENPGELCDPFVCDTGPDPLEIDAQSPACPLPDGEQGAPYPAGQIFTATGGVGTYAWSQSGLPAGMDINSSTGEIEGTPSAAGGFPFTVYVDDDEVVNKTQASRACSLYVAATGVSVIDLPNTDFPFVNGTITRTFSVANTGASAADFDLQVSGSQFNPVIDGPTTINIPAGTPTNVDVDLTWSDADCPSQPPGTLVDTLVLTATHANIPAVTDDGTAPLTLTFDPGVDVVAWTNGICADPGTTKEAIFNIENTGECEETFDLNATVDMAGWTATVQGGNSITLGPGVLDTLVVDVGIPADAGCQDQTLVHLEATGQIFGAADADSVPECAAQVEAYTINAPADKMGDPGDTLSYCWTITNDGNCSVDILVTPAANWAISPSNPEAYGLQPGQTSGDICIKHVIPAGAQPGDNDDLCITFDYAPPPGANKEGRPVGQQLPIDTCVTSTVRAESCTPDYLVEAVPGNPDLGAPGTTLTQSFRIINNSDTPDKYDMTAEVDLGWGATIQGGDQTGEFVDTLVVNVDVAIPANALCTDEPTLFFGAKSAICDPNEPPKYAQEMFGVDVVCAWEVEAISSDYTGAPGDTATYQFRVTNAGNCEAAPDLQYSAVWPASGPAVVDPIAPGGNTVVNVMHIIPGGAQDGDEDMFEVCAYCVLLPDDKTADNGNCDDLTTRVSTVCELPQPVLQLGDLEQVDWSPPYYTVRVKMINNGPGRALGVTATMGSDIGWIAFQNATVTYGDLDQGGMSWGEAPSPNYIIDMTNWPGGGFNVWFDVTYSDTCPVPYVVRLDPEIIDPNGIEPAAAIPTSFRLRQNVPNPFNPRTRIAFDLPRAQQATLEIFNAAGQRVRTLWSGHLPAGTHEFEWFGKTDQGNDAQSGSYFYSLRSGDKVETKRMVLIR